MLAASLFSAYAEVFLTVGSAVISAGTFLCLRRGVSLSRAFLWLREFFSLPTQRCFPETLGGSSGKRLFSAYAEVFLRTFRMTGLPDAFLCLRRGVSRRAEGYTLIDLFSLPTQRCFLSQSPNRFRQNLFSAYAEVFPVVHPATSYTVHFSLPTQRCFYAPVCRCVLLELFSAYAEVFPRSDSEPDGA